MEFRDEFVADVARYSAPLREAAGVADKFSDKNDEAALAARKMGIAASEAAQKAARAMEKAGEAAEDLAMGEIAAKEAAEAEAKALRELERAAIRAAEAQNANARAAEKAAAIQAIAGVKAGKVTRSQRAEIERLTSAFPDLKRSADTAMTSFADGVKKAETSSAMLTRVGIPGLIAVVSQLPTIAGAAGGALTLAMGGAFTAIGLKASASSAAGKAAIDDLTSHAKSSMSALSKPFEVTWHNIDLAAHEAFSSIEPQAQGMFNRLASSSSLFVRRVGASFHELGPAMDSLGGAFDAVLDKLGTKMPGILRNVSAGFSAIFDAVQRNPAAITDLVDDLSILMRVGGDVTGWLVGAKSKFEAFFHTMVPGSGVMMDFFKWMGMGTDSAKGFTNATQSVAQAAMQAVPPEQNLTNVLRNQKSTADDLKNALDRLTSANMSLDQAEIAQAQAAHAAAQANDHRRKVSLDERSALLSLASADQKLLVGMKASGAGADSVSSKMVSLRAGFVATAQRMGYTAGEAKKLADRYGLLPKSKATHISAPGAQSATAAAYGVANAIRSIPRTWTATVTLVGGGSFQHAVGATGGLYDGARFKYARGGEVSGLISGPGTGTSDDVPAPWLSNGEFVVRERVTSENTLALMALNRGLSWMQAARFAPRDGYAKGGKIKSTGMKPSAKAVAASQARVGLAKARPEYLAAIAAQRALESMRASMYGGLFRGGPSTVGSAHGTVVQHVNQVTVHVAGSVRSDWELVNMIQSALIGNRMPTKLPVGR